MVRKTFFFSALLIVLVTFISFAILYFAMPGYYLHKKQQALQANLDTLTAQLQQATTAEDCAALISAFVKANNVVVLSFDNDGRAVAELSSPLVSLAASGQEDNIYYAIYGFDSGAEPGLPIEPGLSIDNDVTISIRFAEAPQEGSSGATRQKALITHSFNGANVIPLEGRVNTELMSHISVNGTLQPIGEAKGVILSLMPYALLMGIALGLLFSWVYARQISKPILAISAAAQQMQHLQPEARSTVDSKDELGLLSDNLNALYASLCENIDQLKQEMEKVNRLERAKTELMQSASHELKTPIAALSGMLEGMIDNIGVYHDKEKYLRECKGQVEKLSALVAEILSASQADGSWEADFMDTAVAELVKQALADHTLTMEDKGLRLNAELAPVLISTDPSALYRVLTNLVGNAARHTPPDGEVRVSLSPARFSIENSCPPIPAEELPKMFEPFYTMSYSRDKNKSGTGLGLYIVKRNLERLKIPYIAESTELGIKITLLLKS